MLQNIKREVNKLERAFVQDEDIMREIDHIGEIVEFVDKIQAIDDSVPLGQALRDLIKEPEMKPLDNLEDICEEIEK